MGFLGGDNEQDSGRGQELVDQQLQMNQAELEEKKHALYQTRLDIIKGQGRESWSPNIPKATPSPFRQKQNAKINPFHPNPRDFIGR